MLGEVDDGRSEKRRIIAKMAEGIIVAVAKKAANLVGLVIVIDGEAAVVVDTSDRTIEQMAAELLQQVRART